MRTYQKILMAGFLTAILLPSLQMALGFYRKFDNLENRELAKAPELDTNRLWKWSAECEAYLSDRFGFRPDLIRWNSVLRVRMLGVSPIRSVVLGKDSWLFYRSEALDDGDSLNDHQGAIPLSRRELDKLRQRLENNRRRFASLGIPYLMVIAPNKNTIYGEYLPDSIGKLGHTTRLDQFMTHLGPVQDVLDLRGALMQAKREYPVYFRTDSHWNSYGAYTGYREIMRRLTDRFPQLAPASISESGVAVEKSLPGGDLAQMLFMQDLLPEENHTRFSLRSIPGTPPMGTLLFRHDSFGDNLYPFLEPVFKKIINVAPFAPFRFDVIERERPQIVLHVFAERYLPQVLQDDFFYKEERLDWANRRLPPETADPKI